MSTTVSSSRAFGAVDLAKVAGGAVALALLVVLLFASHDYLYRAFAEPWLLRAAPEWQGVVRAAFAVAAVSLILMPAFERALRPPFLRMVAWPISIWMGVYFFSFLALLASDLLLRWPGAVLGFATDGAAFAEARALILGALLAVVIAAALRSGLGPPSHRRVEIALEGWPRERDGFRIVQISDIHIGPLLDRRFAAHLAERVNALDPDLVAVTGDLVDGPLRTLSDEVEPFGAIRAREGVFFVTGNHDHYSGDAAWVERVGELGWTVLRNRRVTIGQGAAAFELAGVDDHRGGMMPGSDGGEDLDAALGGLGCDASDARRAVVLLAHDPSTFKRAHDRGIDLQLSGHTHGGQIWPFRYAVRMAIPFVAGRYSRGKAELYVSRGTGFWGPPMRLGAPAEIGEIVLRSASAG